MIIEEDLNFWFHLWVTASRKASLDRENSYTPSLCYQVDNESINLLCSALPYEAAIKLTFSVEDLYVISFSSELADFTGRMPFTMENTHSYWFDHFGLSREEFDHHMIMLKLQVTK